MSKSILSYVKTSEDNDFAFVLVKSESGFEVVHDISKALNDNAYLCYFDPSPLLPSQLLKNYLSKLRAFYNQHSQVAVGTEFTLKVLSIRDKISKLTTECNMKDTFYLEFKFTKEAADVNTHLKLKGVDMSTIKNFTITLKDQMDPKIIAEEAVDLNLKLMKWRMAPGLDL